MTYSFIKIKTKTTFSTQHVIKKSKNSENNSSIFDQINNSNFFSNVQTYVRHKFPESEFKEDPYPKVKKKIYSKYPKIESKLKKSRQKEVSFTKSRKKVLSVFMFSNYITFPLHFSSSLLLGYHLAKPNVQTYVRHKLTYIDHSPKINYISRRGCCFD